jgi:hypothetical protein
MFVAALVLPLHAAADPAPPETGDEAEDEADAGTRRAAAPDTRTGHVLVDAKLGGTAPAGRFTSGTSVSDVTGIGMSVGGRLGLGISRYVVVDASGTYSLFSHPRAGIGHNGRSFDLGVDARYHLAQGVALDPWVSFGLGLRLTNFTTFTPLADSQKCEGEVTPIEGQCPHHPSYRGLDFAKIAFGVDFYPLPFLGFGPYVQADLGTNFSQQDPKSGRSAIGSSRLESGQAIYAFIHVGLRIAFDPVRSGSPRARAAEARR